jgi:cholera toxin transcriptional activator
MSSLEKRIFRFGVFEADASSGELRKAGMRLRLQEQPFQVLILLLERPGEVITRDEIRQRLWPSDTFVDFDHSLNTNINKIREALNDSAANPRFIETLAKRGYRLLVPVDVAGITDAPSGLESTPRTAKHQAVSLRRDQSPTSTFRLTQMEELPAISPSYVRGLFFLIQVMYLVFYILALWRISAVQDVIERMFGGYRWVTVLVTVSASIGIPVRLYLLSAVSFDIKDLSRRFLKMFPGILALDELWALSPFLLERQIGIGLALGMTAALAYVPFAQRTLVLMRERVRTVSSSN